ncbi:hypothetical protein HanPI659440_Chr15g0616121 [Helianthus annuus]|nr:hypothetical protein HanPI659440_Chr15g0616121 [Helianthus annuus]
MHHTCIKFVRSCKLWVVMHVGRNIKGSSFNVPSYLAHSFIVIVLLCHKSCKSNILQLIFFSHIHQLALASSFLKADQQSKNYRRCRV